MMKKANEIKKERVVIPNYTRREELINMISHIIGAIFGLVALIILLILSVKHNNTPGIITSIVYSMTIIILYSCSACYHGINDIKPKKVFRVLDHCSIFLLIAGTYTVIAISGVVPVYPIAGYLMFGIVWTLSILGIILNAISIKKFQIISMILNILIGWMAVFFVYYVISSISVEAFILILAGGLCYTIGAILYGIGKRKKYFHSVFHIFCILGTVIQFLGIAIYCV